MKILDIFKRRKKPVIEEGQKIVVIPVYHQDYRAMLLVPVPHIVLDYGMLSETCFTFTSNEGTFHTEVNAITIVYCRFSELTEEQAEEILQRRKRTCVYSEEELHIMFNVIGMESVTFKGCIDNIINQHCKIYGYSRAPDYMVLMQLV